MCLYVATAWRTSAAPSPTTGRTTINRIIVIVTSAATFCLCPVAWRMRRYSDLNTIARTVPHRMAPLNGHESDNATVTTINSSKITVLFQIAHHSLPEILSGRCLAVAAGATLSIH